MPKRKEYNPELLEKMKDLEDTKRKAKDIRNEIKSLEKKKKEKKQVIEEKSFILNFD